MLIPGHAPGSPVAPEDIDLFDPTRFSTGSQHPSWHTLRAGAPLWRQSTDNNTEFCSVTRYEDVLAVIKNHRSFSSEYGTILAVLGGDSAAGKTINLMDRPRHTALRGATMPQLSTGAVLRLAERTRARVHKTFEPLRDAGTVDVAELTAGLAMAVVGDIIGVPEEHWRDVASWSMTGVAPEDPVYADGTDQATLRSAHFELFALFHDLVRERMRRPADDLVSTLIATPVDGVRLSLDEVILNCYSLVMGANTTTPHVASHMLLALAERPDQWHRIRANPALTSRAVEEAARWATPTNHLVRRATRTFQLSGGTVQEGELVAAWVGSANRDESVFADPYRFDAGRRPNPHLAFGFGIHYCNGAPGARTVLRQTLEEVLDIAEGLEVAGPVTHLQSNFINGITSLPIAVTPAVTGAMAARTADHPGSRGEA
jgi:cytochrome P450